MNLKEQIASRITQARKAQGITIKALSTRIGTLSAARISNWEQGTRTPGPGEATLLSKQLGVALAWLFCATNNPRGEFLDNAGDGMSYVPVLSMQDATQAKEILSVDGDISSSMIAVDGFNPSNKSKALFAVRVEDNSMQPHFNSGDMVVVDGEAAPKPGDYVLSYLIAKKQVVLRKYGEANGCLFQLLASNELWAMVNVKSEQEAVVCGVVIERRQYF